MKAFFVPASLLSLILLVSALTSTCVHRSTAYWIDTLNTISELVNEEEWSEANTQLSAAEKEWLRETAVYHIIMEHQDLDEAEKLFSAVIAACREEDKVQLQVYLVQLITQLEFLSETQKISWKNVL